MPFVVEILVHTPIWVWAVLVLLIWFGLSATRDREVSAKRVLITPAIATLLVLGHLLADAPTATELAALALGLAFGSVIGAIRYGASGSRRVAIGRLYLPGSWSSLLVLLTIFFIRYVSGVLDAVAPQLVTSTLVLAATTLVSGLLVGMSATMAVLRLHLAYAAT